MSRYSRQIIIPGFGKEKQNLLAEAKVIIIGAGALGVPVLQYLTGAGVGQITIVDYDTVDISNLHRQVIYTEAEIGQSKTALAKAKMQALNSEIKITALQTSIDANNALEIIDGHDIIIDCTDNFPTRYLLNDSSVLLDIPLIYGAIFRWEGQVSVFNYKGSPNYRDLFPHPPNPGEVPNCEEGGVLGVLPGIIGSMQALEAIKIITDTGDPLSSNLLMYDAKSATSQIIKFKPRPDNPISSSSPTITELIDYEAFCGLKNDLTNKESIDALTLKSWLASDKEFQLIDVREKEEYNLNNIGGYNIPLSLIKREAHQIEDDIPVVFLCQTGKRSLSVVQFLKKEHDFDNLINLEGGIDRYEK